MKADRPHILLYAEAVLRIERRARMSPFRETGGLLLGFRVADDVHAVDAVEVHDRAASPNRYLLRKRLADKALSDYLAGLPEDSAVGYVGLWHTHPRRASGRLSPIG